MLNNKPYQSAERIKKKAKRVLSILALVMAFRSQRKKMVEHIQKDYLLEDYDLEGIWKEHGWHHVIIKQCTCSNSCGMFLRDSLNWSKLKGTGVPATLQVQSRPEKYFVIVIVPWLWCKISMAWEHMSCKSFINFTKWQTQKPGSSSEYNMTLLCDLGHASYSHLACLLICNMRDLD